jgi:ferritin-like metal-binding protein YciE
VGRSGKPTGTANDRALEDAIENAQDEQVRGQFRHHQEETKGHFANGERVFELFGWDVDDSPCPAIEALHKEAKANVKKTDDAIVDSILLGAATEVEHQRSRSTRR